VPLRPLASEKPYPTQAPPVNTTARVRLWFGVLALISAIFVLRLFYLQVIKHDYYHQAALHSQLKQYEVEAERGAIVAHDGDSTTPIVLNEKLYTLFADPTFVKDPAKASLAIAPIIKGDANKVEGQLKTKDTRYVVLAKKLSGDQKNKLDKLNLLGIGTRETEYRTYPQGALASQLLGFVNDDGQGQYGLEEYLDKDLKGTPGELKAITDAQGVPLVSNKSNIVTDPRAGDQVTMTIDIGVQRSLEDILKAGLDRVQSKSGSAIIMNPNTGAIVAMANYPTYDPSKLADVTDLSLLGNAAASAPLEVGSIMKTLTSSSALDQGVVNLNSSFYDAGFVQVGDRKITDVEDSRGTQTIESILVNSLNTGAVWMLKQMGGGDISAKARSTWYDYMTSHFGLGSTTGVEQAGEAEGYIPKPTDTGTGIQVTYANTAFGQAMTATPLQMLSAFSSIVNGGTYYRPRLVDSYKTADGKTKPVQPDKVRDHVVSSDVSNQMVKLLGQVARINIPTALRNGYIIGGKTGTAQISQPGGGYYGDKFNGTYLGYVGGDKPQYVIVVRVNEPKTTTTGFAGSGAAAPIFKDLSNMLIDNFGVTPKSQ